MKGFGSDNHSGVHPEFLKAITEANSGHVPSYGTDIYTEQCQKLFKKILGQEVGLYFVFNGTAANVLSLKSMVRSYQSVLCADVSHLNVDECGAPEFLAGCKLIGLPSLHGKLNLETLQTQLIRRGDQHFSQIRGVSLTQTTEFGTCYGLEEIKAICQWAHENGLFVHLDGARLSNAVAALQTNFKSMLVDTGVDVVSWGGTKNGFLFGEAVVFINRELEKDFQYVRKQACQLPSKTRFIAAQFLKAYESDLWLQIANHSLSMAKALFEQVKDIPGVQVTHPVQGNVVFATIPKSWVKPLREKYFFYVINEKTFESRWMCSWDTNIEDVHGFAKELRTLSTSLGKA